MSKLLFQAVVELTNAVQGDGNWDITLSLEDREGVFYGNSITVGDVLVFDTASVEPGTFTRYLITAIRRVSWTGEVDLTVVYDPTNNNDSVDPPLDYVVGQRGVISRPSEFLGLLPVVSAQRQNISDAFSFYTLNQNLVQQLDAPRSDGGGSVVLYTAQWLGVNPMTGRVELPSVPLGDFVLDMGLAYLLDGSIVEVVGLKPAYDDSSESWFTVIPETDMLELGGMVGALTVTYLIKAP